MQKRKAERAPELAGTQSALSRNGQAILEGIAELSIKELATDAVVEGPSKSAPVLLSPYRELVDIDNEMHERIERIRSDDAAVKNSTSSTESNIVESLARIGKQRDWLNGCMTKVIALDASSDTASGVLKQAMTERLGQTLNEIQRSEALLTQKLLGLKESVSLVYDSGSFSSGHLVVFILQLT